MLKKTRICESCGIDKSVKRWATKAKCYTCYRKSYIVEYNVSNAAKIKKQKKEYNAKNKDTVAGRKRKYDARNRDKIASYKKEWCLKNKEYLNSYFREKYNNDVDHKLSNRLRNRLNKAIISNQKAGSAVKDLSCSIPELKKYLESQFQPGMSWSNWNLYGWHIDHIKPLCKFDLADLKEFKRACHYSNLQPLWAEDNLKKGNR